MSRGRETKKSVLCSRSSPPPRAATEKTSLGDDSEKEGEFSVTFLAPGGGGAHPGKGSRLHPNRKGTKCAAVDILGSTTTPSYRVMQKDFLPNFPTKT